MILKLFRKINRCLLLWGIALPLAIAVPINAAPPPPSLTVWPNEGSLPPNAVISIKGGPGLGPSWLDQLEPCELHLVSGTDRTCLLEIERFRDERRGLTGAFKPERPLVEGQTYALMLSDPLKDPTLNQWLNKIKRAPRQWTVDLPADHSAPQWLGRPELKSTEYDGPGCGHSIMARFAMPVLDDSPIRAEVTLREAGTRQERRAILAIVGQTMSVGGSEFFSPFRMKIHQPYEVRVDALVDVAGNRTEGPKHFMPFSVSD